MVNWVDSSLKMNVEKPEELINDSRKIKIVVSYEDQDAELDHKKG